MRKDPFRLQRARALRRDSTPAEKVLWRELRGRRFGGFKFRRQQPFGRFVLDFFCAELSLAIELDGESHLGKESDDAERQQWLAKCGLKVLRFWNTDIYEDLDVVLEAIWAECVSRCGRPLTPNPSPPKGRGGKIS